MIKTLIRLVLKLCLTFPRAKKGGASGRFTFPADKLHAGFRTLIYDFHPAFICTFVVESAAKFLMNLIQRNDFFLLCGKGLSFGVFEIHNLVPNEKVRIMGYTIQDVRREFSANVEEIEKYIRLNKIKIGKNGTLPEKSYQILLNLFSSQEVKQDIKPVNGHKIVVTQKPVFVSEDSRISLFQDDAISFLKSLAPASVDVIITDPAYSGMNQRLKLGRGKIIGKYADAGKNGAKWFEEFHDTEENYTTFLKECYRVLKNNRHIYIMFDSYSLLSLAPIARNVFEVKNVLCWDKANIGLGHYFRRRHEFILFASKGKRRLNSRNIPDVWKIKRVTASKYATQKPTEVFELMLKGSAEKDFVVCDPFIGSGSSAIAAIKHDCKFVGCDMSDKAISVSSERVKQYLKSKEDVYQKKSHLCDDEAMTKLFVNGKSK